MALWSLIVQAGSLHYSTQVGATSAKVAVGAFLKSNGLASVLQSEEFKDWPQSFSPDDIVVFIPMEGLVNMYLVQLGREGKYISLNLIRTVSRAQT